MSVARIIEEGLSPLKKTLSQRDGSAMHSLLPVSAWKRQEFDFMTAVSLISFGPGLMAEAVVGRDQKYPHGGYRLQVTDMRLIGFARAKHSGLCGLSIDAQLSHVGGFDAESSAQEL